MPGRCASGWRKPTSTRGWDRTSYGCRLRSTTIWRTSIGCWKRCPDRSEPAALLGLGGEDLEDVGVLRVGVGEGLHVFLFAHLRLLPLPVERDLRLPLLPLIDALTV